MNTGLGVCVGCLSNNDLYIAFSYNGKKSLGLVSLMYSFGPAFLHVGILVIFFFFFENVLYLM